MPAAKTATKKVAKVAKKVAKKEEGFLLLIVFKTTHGSLFSKHTHYSSNLMKVENADMARNHTKAAKKAAEMMSEAGAKCEVVISERVDALDQNEMHAQVKAKLGDLGKLGEILENL